MVIVGAASRRFLPGTGVQSMGREAARRRSYGDVNGYLSGDSRSKKMIWRDRAELYYKKGLNDPDYCVLKFTAQDGRYYHNFKSEDFEV
jgi:general stress protein 26